METVTLLHDATWMPPHRRMCCGSLSFAEGWIPRYDEVRGDGVDMVDVVIFVFVMTCCGAVCAGDP